MPAAYGLLVDAGWAARNWPTQSSTYRRCSRRTVRWSSGDMREEVAVLHPDQVRPAGGERDVPPYEPLERVLRAGRRGDARLTALPATAR